MPETSVGLVNSKIKEFFLESWNVPVTTLKLIVTGRQAKAVNATTVQVVIKALPETFDTMSYHRQITPEHLRMVLQAQAEGSSLQGISRISSLAYETVVSIMDATRQKAQMIHNQALQSVDSEAIGADEFWSFVEKNKKTAHRALRA